MALSTAPQRFPFVEAGQTGVVFSRNSRGAAVQFEQKLCLVDLQVAKIEPAEVRIDTRAAPIIPPP